MDLGHTNIFFSMIHLTHAVVGEKDCKGVKGGKGEQGQPRVVASSWADSSRAHLGCCNIELEVLHNVK